MPRIFIPPPRFGLNGSPKLNHGLGQSLPDERIAWVKILGVPAHIWIPKIFNDIASRFGSVVSPSIACWDDCNMGYDYMGILINSGKRLEENLVLRWKSKSFRVWVSETECSWLPEFLDNPSTSEPSTTDSSSSVRISKLRIGSH